MRLTQSLVLQIRTFNNTGRQLRIFTTQRLDSGQFGASHDVRNVSIFNSLSTCLLDVSTNYSMLLC